MQKLMLLTAIALTATTLVAADKIEPLDVKTGLWQVTTTMAINGMGAPQTHTYKSCVTKENQSQYPFGERDQNCNYTVQSSTGTQMAVSGSCLNPNGEKADFKIQLEVVDAEHAQGKGELTLAGPRATMHGEYSGKGKWIAASCPAQMQ
jgi:Protein of unknown function (DUF3617)